MTIETNVLQVINKQPEMVQIFVNNPEQVIIQDKSRKHVAIATEDKSVLKIDDKETEALAK